MKQIVNEGFWGIPEGVKVDLEKIISDGTITLELLSKIAKVDKGELKSCLNNEIPELKIPSESVFTLMELTRNLNSEWR